MSLPFTDEKTDDMFYGAQPQLFADAKRLRKAMTPAETVLWEQLRSNRFHGFRFKAQHPIRFFVADFYCHSARLVVELDGGVHDTKEQQELDADRTQKLEELGIKVLRFKNDEVFHCMTKVLNCLASHLPFPPPLPEGDLPDCYKAPFRGLGVIAVKNP